MQMFMRMGGRSNNRLALAQCGVLVPFLAFFLAFVLPVREANATNPVEEFGYLSEETTRAIERELGINLGYMFAINRRGSLVIGVPPETTIEPFENQLELWRKKRRIVIKDVKSLDIIRFRRNPLEQCFPYPAFGSLRWYCITFPD
jgi:hypothetical protein